MNNLGRWEPARGGVPVAANHSSPLHFRPARGRLCDTIPFHHEGEYHIFYIRCDTEGGVPWDHIVSRDLVHWHELPTALDRDPSDPHGPDGRDMFTGCVVEHDGVFHIFYTGHNPANPDGAEIICHATSADLVTWQKHREHCFGPDGAVYHPRDFRDPFVFRHEEAGEWWMLLCAGLAGSDFSGIGRLVSTDLVSWKPAEPLLLDPPLLEGETGAPECPDLFRIGELLASALHDGEARTSGARATSRGRSRTGCRLSSTTPCCWPASACSTAAATSTSDRCPGTMTIR